MGGEDALKQGYDVCMGANLTCMNDMMNRMGQFDHVEYENKQVNKKTSTKTGSPSKNVNKHYMVTQTPSNCTYFSADNYLHIYLSWIRLQTSETHVT